MKPGTDKKRMLRGQVRQSTAHQQRHALAGGADSATRDGRHHREHRRGQRRPPRPLTGAPGRDRRAAAGSAATASSGKRHLCPRILADISMLTGRAAGRSATDGRMTAPIPPISSARQSACPARGRSTGSTPVASNPTMSFVFMSCLESGAEPSGRCTPLSTADSGQPVICAVSTTDDLQLDVQDGRALLVEQLLQQLADIAPGLAASPSAAANSSACSSSGSFSASCRALPRGKSASL